MTTPIEQPPPQPGAEDLGELRAHQPRGAHRATSWVSSRNSRSRSPGSVAQLVQLDPGARARAGRPRRCSSRRRAGPAPASRTAVATRPRSAAASRRGRGSAPAPTPRRLSRASRPWVTSRPWAMTTTSSTVCCTSASTWLETRTVRPSAASERRNPRSQAMPGRVEPVRRLVEHQHRRVAEQGLGEAEPLPHAEREPADPAVGVLREADQAEHLVDPGAGEARCLGQEPQVVARRPAGVEARGLERGPDRAQGVLQVAVAPPADERLARRWGVTRPSRHAASSSCPRRWGRGTRSPARARR